MRVTTGIRTLALGAVLSGCQAQPVSSVAQDMGGKPMVLFVNGQSNGAGAGTANHPPPVELRAAIPNVFIYHRVGAARFGFPQYQATVDSDPSQPAGNTYGLKYQQWGPEAGFALKWHADHPFRRLYILQDSLYGAELASPAGVCHGVSTWDPSVSTGVFPRAVKTAAAALTTLASLGVKNYDSVDIWMQGESDAQTLACAQAYYANEATLFSAMRSRFGLGPNLTILNGRISDSSKWVYRQYVREAEGRVATDSPKVKMFDTDGIALVGALHYDASSNGMIQVGYRAYQEWRGSYADVAPAFARSYTARIPEQGGTGDPVITIAATNKPNPSVIYDIPNGQSGCRGLAVDENGDVTESDPTQLTVAGGATRTCNLRGSNGVATLNTILLKVILTVNNPSDVGDVVFRTDPTAAASLTPYSGSRRPQLATFPGGTRQGFKFAASGASATGFYVAPTAAIADQTTTAAGFGLDTSIDRSATGKGTIWFGGFASGTTTMDLALGCNLATDTLVIDYILAANRAVGRATTNAPCGPGQSHADFLQYHKGELYLYQDQAATPSAVTLAAGGAARPTLTAPDATAGINIGGITTVGVFAGLWSAAPEIIFAKKNLSLAERKVEFANLLAAMR